MIAAAQRNGQRVAWETVELSSCFELQNGVNFSAEQKGRGLLVVDVLNMYSDDLFVRTDRLYRVDIKVAEDRLLRQGDVLFVRSSVKESGVGWPAIFKGHDEPVTNCGFLIRARQTKPKLDPKFFVHYLRQAHVRTQMISRAGKVAITNINQERLGSLKIPLPPLAEQRRIAEVLDRAEALRAKRRAALAQLDSLTQSLFLDLFGDPKFNPKAWQQQAMAELFATSPIFGSMIPPVAEKCGWLSLRVGNIQDWTLDLSDSKYVDLPAASVERHSVKDGDLLLARAIASQDHLGKCVIAHPNSEQWAFDSHLMRLRFDFKRAEPEFIRHLFMTPGGRSLFLKASRKSTVQFNINTKEISALRIPVPPIPLQREFARRVTAVEALKTAQRASLAELDALFATLQYRAFKGEL